MKRNALFGLSLIAAYLLLNSFAYAAGLVPCNGADCTWCSLIQMVQNLINYAIYLGVLASAVMFAYAGVLYFTYGTESLGYGGAGNIEKAKQMFGNIITGLVCILAGWLLVDTLMKAMTGDKIGPWNKIECSTTASDNNTSLPTGGSVRSNNKPRSYSDINQ